MDTKKEYLTIYDICEALHCSRSYVYQNLLKRPDCPVLRVGRHVLFGREAFFAWFEAEAAKL